MLSLPAPFRLRTQTSARTTEHAERRFWEFFTAHIRNPNTRLAYLAAVRRFAEWCERRGLALDQVEPMVVAAYIEQLSGALSPASVKQHLAALRMLFDWLIVGQVLPFNPASSVRGPKHVVKTGKTPVLSGGADNRISTGAPAGMMTPESGCGSVSRRLTVSRVRGMNPHGDLERRSNFHQGADAPWTPARGKEAKTQDSIQRPGNSETEIAAAGSGGVPDAIRGTHEPRILVPRAAAQHPA